MPSPWPRRRSQGRSPEAPRSQRSRCPTRRSVTSWNSPISRIGASSTCRSTGPSAQNTCFPSAACTSSGVQRDRSTVPLSCGETSLGADRTGPACRHQRGSRALRSRTCSLTNAGPRRPSCRRRRDRSLRLVVVRAQSRGPPGPAGSFAWLLHPAGSSHAIRRPRVTPFTQARPSSSRSTPSTGFCFTSRRTRSRSVAAATGAAMKASSRQCRAHDRFSRIGVASIGQRRRARS
jgi:hypothetical protein